MSAMSASDVIAVAVPTSRESQKEGWDSRLFILGGASRDQVRDRARELLDRLSPDASADDLTLARALSDEWNPSGLALAIVATSIADLVAKLGRACDRLARPECKQIRDAAGVYFTDRPLYREGSLALLFPGEGAQYSGMLADLCGVFPEVEETFAWSDRLAAEAGRPGESLRRLLHLPPDAAPEERAAAEAQLRRLSPSIFSVIIADMALSCVLQRLALPVSAVAGHSAGELTALVAAGAIPGEAFLGPTLTQVMDVMQRQEDESGGPDVLLLAVGAGKAAVEQAAGGLAAGAAFIAMDNCPHQCVVVGEAATVARVESALLERGTVCERLPFHRPYHTPLFEPWMGPYRELFAAIPFQEPHTPIYCCTTGEPFPKDGGSIRDLTVNQWVTPVAFSEMIERMYADGVRLFVEAGPRGNLSAFVEDILRGKSFAAIPSNVARRSGPTQINHLVAQLVVHGVPVQLGSLFGPSGSEEQGSRSSEDGKQGSVEAMNAYLDVMEQFLDVQRSVMEAFLAGNQDLGRSGPSAVGEILHLADFAFPELPPCDEEPSSEIPAPTYGFPRYALIERVEHLEPGRSIVARRTLDEREDLYSDHHTLAGRGVSRVDPGQNGLPVLPMTFSLEAMAEAAAILAPGKVVAAIRDVRLFRWVPFDPEPTIFEVRAAVASFDPDAGTVEVKADVRDLGNSFVKDGANKPAAEAVIVLADRYSEPPPLRPFQLSREQPCRSTVADLRRNMFHGPLFQMIRHLGRCGDEGIEGTLEVQSRTGWFRSNSEPHVLLDPALVDSAMHLLGAWHLEQPDWTGRILLPFEVQRFDVFGPPPDPGTALVVRGHNEQASARHFRHGVEIFHPDGRLWLSMTGVGYWRFYLPFGHVNFFGPKDEYYLSREWNEALTPGDVTGRCYYLDPPADLKQPVLRAAGARVTLTPREQSLFRSWTGTDEELNAWFFGRLVAKDAVRAAWMAKHGEATFPADMESEDVEGRLTCRPRGEAGPKPYPSVAVAMAGGRVAAFSAFAGRVGIALVTVGGSESEAEVRAKAACLAAADALRAPTEGLEAKAVANGTHKVTAPGHKELMVQTARERDFIVATTWCEP